jgi:hypothetical protein
LLTFLEIGTFPLDYQDSSLIIENGLDVEQVKKNQGPRSSEIIYGHARY